MSKIVLIDGHSILNRAFYGLPDLTNAEGLHTNAIYGFLNIMFKILEEEKPDYLTVAFDVHAPTFRHEMFADYKGTRKPMADELRQQVPVMKDVLHAMGVRTVEKEGLEADDILGTISCRCEKEGMEVVVISGDRDLLQLATEHVKIRIPKTKKGGTEVEDYYASDVKERYLVTPKEFIDVKALMGDASDNIPGVPNIGEKTATKIIAEYGSIENAYEHASELKPPRAAKNIVEYWEQAKLSKELAAINIDAPVDYNLAEAELTDLYTEAAYEYFQRLQFKNLLSRFDVQAKSNSVEDAFRIITDKEEARRIVDKAKTAETAGLVLYKNLKNVLPLFASGAGFGGIGIAFGKEDIYCIPAGEGIEESWLLEQAREIANNVARFVMFDLKSALPYIPIRPEREEHCFDATVAAYLLNPLKNDYTFEDVAREQLNLMIDPKADTEAKVCYEAYTAYAASEPLWEKLTETQMDRLFKQIEMPLVFTLFDMEQNGVMIESEALRFYGNQLGSKIVELEKEIYEMAGEEFNINSPKQLGVVLFEHMQLPNGKKTKTGYSTAADVLDKLAPDYPVVSKILEYRQLTKLKSTYADGLAAYIGEDGRIHGKFNQTITATGRISSTEPNLQNIPIRMELGRLIRKVFIPEDGYVFVDADYSQIELRVLAHCSGDKELIQAYREAKDIHRITASQVFHTPFDEVTDLQRRNAKAVNFGIVYGISSFGLSQDLSITRKEASQYIERYFETYPGIKEFLDDTVAHAKEMGYVVTLFGRRRPVPELKSSNFMQRSFGERVAMNSPIQGTAADIMKMAMIRVDKELKNRKMKSRLVLQVHDELLIEAWKEELPQVEELLRECMEQAAELDVPLIIDMHTGENWYEAK
ncbi:DNA polymerase I [Bariatricus massiliensis]|uniref:DNA polymerase I n=1 Tax=Bariatricus massiliensis TaxID=1745713 RepID=A0ABS8DDX1_9FIRM|nr:DNA polymerase I [Bariatricus massiliensis]MCB7303202.1 DNA polymerase I [Bariatricus massiliensis]MCB7373334.1 DNA polymerase I [Bariatricus massiliensis]MCB7386004.1 DNA polymerase I [Bariatricus massiliensis]MCB7410166.1 DNA polymerase I [Bariatricus massiliensis]MCQ5252550.1 DNA polymerase I [Bariatricus massiliensis]